MDEKLDDINKKVKIKFYLMTKGVYMPLKIKKLIYINHQEGAIGGLEIVILDNIHLNVPIVNEEHISLASLAFIENKLYIKYEKEYIDVCIIENDDFNNLTTTNNTPFSKVSRLSFDRINFSVLKGCIYNMKNGKACKFCDIAKKKELFYNDLNDIKEVISYSKKNLSHKVKHALITGGAIPQNSLYKYLDVLKLIKKEWDLNTYLMMTPPKDLHFLNELHNEKLDEIAFNLEFWDRKIAKEIMPGKGDISRETYIETLKYATKLWGKNGQVRSLLIVGIEPIENTILAIEYLSKIGVMPILSPFKPVNNTDMKDVPYVSYEVIYDLWVKATEVVKKYNMHLGPKCIACQNNIICVPDSDYYKKY